MDKMVYVVVLHGTGHEADGLLQVDSLFLSKEVAEIQRERLEKRLQAEADQEWLAEVREFPLNEASLGDYYA